MLVNLDTSLRYKIFVVYFNFEKIKISKLCVQAINSTQEEY